MLKPSFLSIFECRLFHVNLFSFIMSGVHFSGDFVSLQSSVQNNLFAYCNMLFLPNSHAHVMFDICIPQIGRECRVVFFATTQSL